MKYIVVLIDGMADEVIEKLNNKTPLEYADIKNINALAKASELGMVHTVPEGMPPGSDVANLSIMGYAPDKYHTGRSPLEAANIGVPMLADDVIFRCNLVTVSEDEQFEDKVMIDHSSSDITSEEASLLMKSLREHLEDDMRKFYDGTSYRNIVVWHKGHLDLKLVPPHDFLEQTLKSYVPEGADWIWEFEKKSYEILKDHPINLDRVKRGLNPANMMWIWGEGRKPKLDAFKELYGVEGVTISAVDLIKGIGRCAEMDAIEVEGATGTIHTNFEGKARATLEALEKVDYVYLHLEATDECSHQGNLDEKIEAIEIIDKKVVKFLIDELNKKGEDYKMMILPDHPTPVRLRTHTSNPVPYMIYDSRDSKDRHALNYHEGACESTGNVFKTGPELTKYFVRK
ncbi:cofactor-independent phosphoglycerate mutase [Acidaminobacter sp. JC074]|uniref:cofactor-independent phosphoglycerate mutase n=1 Tax=Acidaminobacter sp. JC074 TaxID=2530199 RepID=UPI001F117EB9|nr:cofactor-independent phosphoglycerate mutase [Acidaminobacter sp. JC074]MCH4888513.1 cofactor-independent phosphoglycerate mutase [Acidaminobacter sp. JC074]